MKSERDRLLEKARGCHELAATAVTLEGRRVLGEIASRYEREAAEAAASRERRQDAFA